MSELAKISLRELRERYDDADKFAFDPEVLALVEAVEAAHAVMWKPVFHWDNRETLALLDAVARFKDYGEAA